MGKKVKKKNSRTPSKEKQVASSSPRKVPQNSSTAVEIADDGAFVVKERKQCCHLDKCLNFNELSSKIGSSEQISCEDCRDCSGERRGSKGRAKQGKKKGGAAVDGKSDSKAIWICLQCGHYACGGIGLPTSSQTHAIRHVRQTRHPVVIQFENPQLRWCFPCNTLIPVEKTEVGGDQKDGLFNVVKLIRERVTEVSTVDVENALIQSGEVTAATKSESSIVSDLDNRNCYVVKGLINLGNTCFFNSVLQNLLAMDTLRDYFLKLEECVGPLTIALKKLFIEARAEGRTKGSLNPRLVFGCISSKAPQFKGYDQHDSHELLRVLLDGLSTEELASRKMTLSKGERISANASPTFVDEMFGGQISSTVCCIECGHTSTVYEPFLDLSLSVPTKKPLTKKSQPVSRAKKTKMPSKRNGKTLPKTSKAANVVSVQSPPAPSASSGLSVTALAGSVDTTSVIVEKAIDCQEPQREVVIENGVECTSDDFTWLDFLGSEPNVDNNDISITQDSENNDEVFNNDDSSRSMSEAAAQVPDLQNEFSQKPDFSAVDSWDDESQLQAQASEVLLLPYKEESSSAEGAKHDDQASSSNVACTQDDYDDFGFADMFNEPEIVEGPIARASENTDSGFLTTNISESDPDEVDNTDSPVSVESCLSYFTKPELLSKDNGYNCEKCAKRMQQLRLEMQERRSKASGKILANGHQTGVGGAISCFSADSSLEVRNQNNVKLKNSSVCSSDGESLVRDHIDRSRENCTSPGNSQACELNSILRVEEANVDTEDVNCEQSCSSGCNNTCNQGSSGDNSDFSFSTDDHPRGVGLEKTNSEPSNSQVYAENGRVEKSEDDEMDSDSTTMAVARDATKRFSIHRAPPILTIHIKRFSPDARGRYSKMNGYVSFKETIDLKPYLDSRCGDRENYKYRLVGVVEHSGSMRGGHYVAYVRGGNSNGNNNSKRKSSEEKEKEKEKDGSVWYYASDASVHEVSLNKVLSCEAYILFYEIT